jgi:hypothetical protein
MIAKQIVAAGLVVLLAAPSLAWAQGREPGVWRTYAETLDPNTFVKVSLSDGTRLKGHVMGVGDGLRIKPRKRVAVPLREIPFSEIVTIDVQKEPRWNPAVKVLMGVGIGVGTFMFLTVLALASAYD